MDDLTEKDEIRLRDDFDEYTVKKNKQYLNHQKLLFWFIGGFSVILMGIALFIAYGELSGTPSNAEVAILGLIITAPVILLLALMRYIYDGSKKSKEQLPPTLLLNVGKELATVIKDVFKK